MIRIECFFPKSIKLTRSFYKTIMSVLSTIYEFATPSKGAFRDHIGSIQYTTIDGQVYETLIMTKTGVVITEKTAGRNKVKKEYPTIAGYIQVNKFVD